MSKKILGVLGGMGPQASARFYNLVIEEARKRGATRNEDYPHLLIDNIPVPDFISDAARQDDALLMMEQELLRLEGAGVALMGIACNTMHLHIERFRNTIRVPIISMVDEVIKRVKRDQRTCVGVLGTPTTIATGLYSRPLVEAGLEVRLPSSASQCETETIIRDVIAGRDFSELQEKLCRIALELVEQGVDAIVLGCTELPLVAGSAREKVRQVLWYDSLEILTEAFFESTVEPPSQRSRRGDSTFQAAYEACMGMDVD